MKTYLNITHTISCFSQLKNVYSTTTKLLSLTNICISAWQKYLSSVQMHLLKDTLCSGSTIHNFTVQHSLNHEWNFGKSACTIILATQEKIYNYTLFSDIGGGSTVCAHKHHTQSFLSPTAAHASKHDYFLGACIPAACNHTHEKFMSEHTGLGCQCWQGVECSNTTLHRSFCSCSSW